MDSTAVVLRQPLRLSSSYYSADHPKEWKPAAASVVMGRRRRPAIGILSSGFYDQGHLQYYNSKSGPSSGMMTITSGNQEKATKDKAPKMMKKKKQLKLLKGLYRDLSTFSQMGFGLDSDGALLDQVKGNMISEAAEQLLEHLQKVRADEMELKRKIKEDKKAKLKAARMENNLNPDCEMSSGSSSESSDSECGEVVDMNTLKRAQMKQNGLQQVLEEARSSTYPAPTIAAISLVQPNVPEAGLVPVLPITPITEEKTSLQNECCSGTGSTCTKTGDLVEEKASSIVAPACSKKIEVCMGGKCKKSGAAALLEGFQKAVGIEGAVSGCKCMGKCRDGPNVKVLNGFDGGIAADNSVRAPANSLCIGVGLEDVDMIVANLLGEKPDQMSFATAV